MARSLRLQLEDGFYHILARGNERRDIFRDSHDYGRFTELLAEMCARYATEVWSYCLMPNHYHLVLHTSQANLSNAMHWLAGSYSMWHNTRHERIGHLFQGRFKCIVVQEEEYLGQLVLYIHRNPLRAGMVNRVADYPWSSYHVLVSTRKGAGWIPRAKVLDLFGGTAAGFRDAVRDYSEERRSLWDDVKRSVFLGTQDAFARLLQKAALQDNPQETENESDADGLTVEQAAMRLARLRGLSADAVAKLRRPVRGQERPLRDELIYGLWKTRSFGLREIGDHFGIGYSAVANARERAERRIPKSGAPRRTSAKTK